MVQYGDSLEVVFNGIIFMARDRHYSSQFLGSGNTESRAIKDMEDTIKNLNIKYRKTLYR